MSRKSTTKNENSENQEIQNETEISSTEISDTAETGEKTENLEDASEKKETDGDEEAAATTEEVAGEDEAATEAENVSTEEEASTTPEEAPAKNETSPATEELATEEEAATETEELSSENETSTTTEQLSEKDNASTETTPSSEEKSLPKSAPESKDSSLKQNKERKPVKFRVNISEGYQKLQSNVPSLIITCILALIIMMAVCFGIFFANVKGPEQVLVPNVVGESLEDALLEMQVKELYPRINLRYSNNPSDKGTILEQDPEAGTIVKGYSRVSLVVSRGAVVDAVGDYVGQNISDVQMTLQNLFAGQLEPLITLGNPKYIPDTSEPGTILEQDPPEGFRISSPVTVQLVVSRGPNYENTRRPYVIGQNINDLLQTIARSKIVFDITSHTATEEEKAGTVTSQQSIADEFVPNYTRVAIEMAMPENDDQENVYGIFKETLTEYPYPISMRLDAIPTEGNAYTILNFTHPGGNLTIPYSVPRGTTLVLYVADKVRARQIVE